MEIRAYRAGLKSFRVFEARNEDANFDFEKIGVFEAKRMTKPSFESRFFTKGGEFLNYTEWARTIGLFQEGQGEAVYDLGSGRLVVRTDGVRHAFLHDLLGQSLKTQLRVEVVLRKLNGVPLGRPDFREAKGEVVASLSGLTVSSRSMALRGSDGSVAMEAEFQGGGFNSSFWECRLDLSSLLPGAEITLRTGLAGLFGTPAMVELGSLDGVSTLVAGISATQVFADGGLLVEWVLREDGKDVVEKRRLAKLLHFDRDQVDLGDGRGYEVFVVPPTFWTFLQGESTGAKTLRELLAENGVGLHEVDQIFRLPGGAMFAVEAKKVTLDLIYGLVMPAGQFGPPPILAGHYSLIESDRKLTAGDLKKGGFRVVGKISTSGPPGHAAVFDLGKGKFEAESELQSSMDAGFVEAGFTLKGRNLAKLEQRIEGEVGLPLIVRQEKAGELWRAWVAVFSARRVEEMVKEGR